MEKCSKYNITVELKCFRQATRSVDTIASIHRAWPSGTETCTFSLIPKRPRPHVGVVVYVRHSQGIEP